MNYRFSVLKAWPAGPSLFTVMLLLILLLSTTNTIAQKRAVAPSEPEPPSNPISPPSHTDPITDDPDSPYLLPDNPAGVPIDGGASLLIVGGSLAGAAALRRRRKAEEAAGEPV